MIVEDYKIEDRDSVWVIEYQTTMPGVFTPATDKQFIATAFTNFDKGMEHLRELARGHPGTNFRLMRYDRARRQKDVH